MHAATSQWISFQLLHCDTLTLARRTGIARKKAGNKISPFHIVNIAFDIVPILCLGCLFG
jgi:hypothetical protein